MAYRNLDEFLTRLEQEGEATRHQLGAADDLPVVSDEAAHVYDYSDGTRVVQNLFGTRTRIEMALRVESLDEIAANLDGLLDLGKPGAFGALMTQGMALFSALRTNVNRRAAQQYTQQTFATWRDSLPSAIAGGAVGLHATLFTAETMRPATLTLRPDGLAMQGPPLSAGSTVALAIGGDPALTLAGVTPLPDVLHRSYLASWLRGRPLETMRLPSLEIDLPSNVDAVIVGTVRDGAAADDDTGYLELRQISYDVTVTAVWARPLVAYQVWSPQDTVEFHRALGHIFAPLVRRLLPRDVTIEDYLMYIDRLWLE